MSKAFESINPVDAKKPLGYPFTLDDLFSLIVEHPQYDDNVELIKKHYETVGEFCEAIDEDMIKKHYNGEYGLKWSDLEDYIHDAFLNLKEIKK